VACLESLASGGQCDNRLDITHIIVTVTTAAERCTELAARRRQFQAVFHLGFHVMIVIHESAADRRKIESRSLLEFHSDIVLFVASSLDGQEFTVDQVQQSRNKFRNAIVTYIIQVKRYTTQ